MEEKNLKHFDTLFSINCNDKVETKSNGSTELSYLSWSYAWAEVKKRYPDANYDIIKFGEQKLPYVFDEKTGYMVFTRVEIEGIEHEMWLPVLDNANKAMKNEPYEYTIKKYDYDKKQWVQTKKEVKPATMYDINKTIMRCLTKNLAMFGLGLYIYAGDDLPEDLSEDISEKVEESKQEKKPTKKLNKKAVKEEVVYATENQKELIKNKYSKEEIVKILVNLKRKKLSDLTIKEASDLLKEEK